MKTKKIFLWNKFYKFVVPHKLHAEDNRKYQNKYIHRQKDRDKRKLKT